MVIFFCLDGKKIERTKSAHTHTRAHSHAKLCNNDLKMMNYNGVVMTTKFIRTGWQEENIKKCGEIFLKQKIKNKTHSSILHGIQRNWIRTVSIRCLPFDTPYFKTTMVKVSISIPVEWRECHRTDSYIDALWVSDATKLVCGFPLKLFESFVYM